MFSENFERICASRGVKPGIACVNAGLKQGRAANWKNTGALPKEAELIALAKALKCRVSEFFLEAGEPQFRSQEEMIEYWTYVDSINPLGGTIDLDDNESDFVGIYRKCTKRQKTQLMNAVFDFADSQLIDYEDM